jgi:hypothetical protein
MLVVVNPTVRRGEPGGNRRKTRRLVYLAWIARDMGHEVKIHLPSSPRVRSLRNSEGRYEFVDIVDDLPVVDNARDLPADAVYLCSSGQALVSENELPKRAKVVIFKEYLGTTHERRLVDVCDLLVAYVRLVTDFSVTVKRPADPSGFDKATRAKAFSVPWRPHEKVTQVIHDDGIVVPFLRDELGAIRAKYGAADKARDVGFIGENVPPRSRITAHYANDDRFIVQWAGGHHPSIPAQQYLWWISECRIVLGLPGDTWKCSRFCEAVMMGVPVVQQAGTIELTPPMTRENTVLLDEWADKGEIISRLDDTEAIVAAADKAYREGWSLRGQLGQIFKRLGVE